jgi:autotransporter-associated beta strand protein
MNPELPKSPREELELRVTALLLGELSEAEAAEVRAVLEQDAELRKLHDDLKKTIHLVREVEAAEPAATAPAEPLRLSAERRERLLAHFKTLAPPEFAPPLLRRVRQWLVPLAAAAIVLMMLGFWMLTSPWREQFAYVALGDRSERYAPSPAAVPASEPQSEVERPREQEFNGLYVGVVTNLSPLQLGNSDGNEKLHEFSLLDSAAVSRKLQTEKGGKSSGGAWSVNGSLHGFYGDSHKAGSGGVATPVEPPAVTTITESDQGGDSQAFSPSRQPEVVTKRVSALAIADAKPARSEPATPSTAIVLPKPEPENAEEHRMGWAVGGGTGGGGGAQGSASAGDFRYSLDLNRNTQGINSDAIPAGSSASGDSVILTTADGEEIAKSSGELFNERLRSATDTAAKAGADDAGHWTHVGGAVGEKPRTLNEPNALQKALSSTTISGYADTSVAADFGLKQAYVAQTDKTDGFNLNFVGANPPAKGGEVVPPQMSLRSPTWTPKDSPAAAGANPYVGDILARNTFALKPAPEVTRNKSGSGAMQFHGVDRFAGEASPNAGTLARSDKPQTETSQTAPGDKGLAFSTTPAPSVPDTALVKSGTGTVLLTGVNSFTGGTSLNGGTLRVDGKAAETGMVDFDGSVDFKRQAQSGLAGSGGLAVSGPEQPAPDVVAPAGFASASRSDVVPTSAPTKPSFDGSAASIPTPGVPAVKFAGITTAPGGEKVLWKVKRPEELPSSQTSGVQVTTAVDKETARTATELGSERAKNAMAVRDGVLLYEQGKLDEADAKLKEVLKQEPGNTAANYYLSLAEETRQARATSNGELQTKGKILQVESAWSMPTAGEKLPVPAAKPSAPSHQLFTDGLTQGDLDQDGALEQPAKPSSTQPGSRFANIALPPTSDSQKASGAQTVTGLTRDDVGGWKSGSSDQLITAGLRNTQSNPLNPLGFFPGTAPHTEGMAFAGGDTRFQLEKRIASAQEELAREREKLKITDSEAAGIAPSPTLDVAKVQSLNANLQQQAAQARDSERQYAKLQALSPAERSKALENATSDPQLTELGQQLGLAQQALIKSQRDFASDNPALNNQEATVKDLTQKINNRADEIMVGLKTEANTEQAHVDSVRREMKALSREDLAKAKELQPYFQKKQELEQLYAQMRMLEPKVVIEKMDATAPRPEAQSTEQKQKTGASKVVVGQKSDSNTPLYTRTFKVNPNAFWMGLENVESVPLTGEQSGKKGSGSGHVSVGGGGFGVVTATNAAVQEKAAAFLSSIGVDSKASGRAVFFNDRQGTLTVRGTLQELAAAEQAVAVLTNAAPDIRIASKFQTAPAAPAKAIADAPLPRKPATNAPVAQPEILTSENNFSTFSLNVSDVSFKLAAASLEKGQMPDSASIRSEEFINAFDYRDPDAAPGVPIAFAWERARYPFAHSRDLLRFSLKTAAEGRQAGRPLNITLLLDNSGSMERADRVSILREALRVLAGQLHPQDKLSVITFARTARLVADGVGGDKAGEVAEQVSGLTPQGGTNLEEAMNLAYQTAARHYLANGLNRVVLLTDGAANLGDVDPQSLQRQVETRRQQGIALDCFGIGWEGFNDDLLEVLSRHGDGRYGFLNSPEEAATEFAGQLAGALKVAASDVKVQVEFNPRRVTAYRQIGYAKHQLTKEQFRDNTVDAAEIAAQEAGNALYTVEVNPAGEGPLGTVRVRYKIPGTTDYREMAWEVPFTGSAVGLDQASAALRLAASASAFSEWLAVNPFAGEVTPDALLNTLRGVPEAFGADPRPRKLEWMIREAKSLEGK